MSILYDDASSEGLDSTTSPISDATTCTLSAWVRFDTLPSTAGTNMAVFGIYDASEVNTWVSLRVNTSDTLQLYARNAGAGAQYSDIGTCVVNTWHHLAASISGSTVTCYLDGSAGTAEDATGNVPSANLDAIGVGHNADSSPNDYTSGRIAECSIYSSALSSGDITSLSNADSPLTVSYSTLVEYWPHQDVNDLIGRMANTSLSVVATPVSDSLHPLTLGADTRQDRFSMMSFGSPVDTVGTLFEADSSVDADDRAHLLYLYSGIALNDPTAGGGPKTHLPLLGVG